MSHFSSLLSSNEENDTDALLGDLSAEVRDIIQEMGYDVNEQQLQEIEKGFCNSIIN